MWMEETIGERVNVNRTREAVETGADQIAVGCPFCRVMLSDGLVEEQSAGRAREEVEVLDVAQLLLASVRGEAPVARASSPRKAAVAAEPSAADDTQTSSTITETADAGPAAKASGGGSLFDTPAPEAPKTESEPESGGSLFDTPAPETELADSGGSLFDVAPTESKPEPKAEEAKSATADASGSLFDIVTPDADRPTEAEKAQAEAVADEKPVTSEPGNGPEITAAEAKEGVAAPAPGTEIGSGSLFDIAAPAAAPEAAPASATEKPDEASEKPDEASEKPDEASEASDADAEADEPEKPATDKKITEGGSLFDL